MAEVLLINPRKRRRKARKARARRANPVSMKKVIRSKPKSNPRRRRRRNPLSLRNVRRVRRNPLNFKGAFDAVVPMVTDAAIGAVGSVGVDYAFSWIKPQLPAALQPVAGKLGAYDAVKAVSTVLLAKLLAKPTRGYSMKMGQGALVVQMDRVIRSFMPEQVKMQLAYANAGRVMPGQMRVGPNAARHGGITSLRAYTRTGARTPLLSGNSVGAYTRTGARTPLLSGIKRGISLS